MIRYIKIFSFIFVFFLIIGFLPNKSLAIVELHNWENLGTAGFSAGQADYTSLAFNNNIPYVAYRDVANG